MFRQQHLQAADPALGREGEMHMQHPLALVEDAAIERGEIGIGPRFRDRHVIVVIGVDHFRKLTPVHRFGEGRLPGLDPRDIPIRPVLRRQPRRQALHQLQRVEMGGYESQIQRGHDAAAIGKDGDEPFAGEADDRLAHRRAREAKALAEPDLVEGRSGLELQAQDLVAQPLIDEGRARPAGLSNIGGAKRRLCRRLGAGIHGLHWLAITSSKARQVVIVATFLRAKSIEARCQASSTVEQASSGTIMT